MFIKCYTAMEINITVFINFNLFLSFKNRTADGRKDLKCRSVSVIIMPVLINTVRVRFIKRTI